MPLAWECGAPRSGPQQAPWARLGGGNARHVPGDPPITDPRGPLLICLSSFSPFLPPSYAPRTYAPGGGSGRQRTWLGAQQVSPGPDWAVDTLATLSCDSPCPGASLQVWEPLPSPCHPPGARVLYSLHSPPPSLPPMSYPVNSGVPPISLDVEDPHQHLVGALVVGRCELRILQLRHLDSAP